MPRDRVPPPPPTSVRLDCRDVPLRVRAAVEDWLGSPVISSDSRLSGFSPGAAATLHTADGRGVFAKAVGAEPNVVAPAFHRRGAQIAAALPADTPEPRLLWTYDEGPGGWVALVFEHVEGRNPAKPWRTVELDRVISALSALSATMTPSPLTPDLVGRATDWPLVTTGWWRRTQIDQLAGLDA